MEYNVATVEQDSTELFSQFFTEQVKDWWDAPRLDSCMHQVFERQVERTPTATAVVFGEETVTYEELNRRANQLAHYLRDRGVCADMPVGICLDRSIEMVVGILGVLKAGGGYLPLDPEYPRDRLSLMLGDSGVRVLLTQKKLTGKLPPHAAEEVRLDDDWDEIAQYGDTNPPDIANAENLVYMIYTSGSTGQPKGVMVPHRALGNHMIWMQQRFPLTTADRVIQKTPFSFDASVWELFAPLLVGARLIMAAPGGHQDVTYLVRFIKEQEITALKIVPSLLEPLLEENGIEECVSLRYVFCGAEAMPVKLVDKFYQHLQAELFNLYGPTEAAIDVTYWECEASTKRRSIPIGRPIINTQVYVLDERLRIVPKGLKGELYVGGESLAHGYWQRAGLTAERFVPHPYTRTAGARLYRTGDVVRWNDAGELEYLGRNDHQVKIRGFRIETGEIETTLLEREEVSRAVVLVREEEGRGKQLAAFIVASNGVEPSNKELREYLQGRMPEYMVPATITVVKEFPLMPNGKVDRRALLALSKETTASEYEGPRNEKEELLVQVWQEVLGLERVGINDNFFELGGDSIVSIQVVAKANQRGLPLRVRQIFQNRTIAKLAKVVNFSTVSNATAPVTDEAAGTVALTPIQQRFFEQGLANPHHFNQSVLLETDDCPEASVLEAVMQKLVAHHAALRLRFTQTETGWQQAYAETTDEPIVTAIDLSNFAEAEQKVTLEAEAARVQASLNITAGPVIRVVLFNCGERGARLLLVVHHLVVDGVSWRILLEDLQTLYSRTRNGEALELPAATSTFKRWSESLKVYAGSAAMQQEAGYWKEQARAASSLPVDNETGVNTVGSVRSVEVKLSREDSLGLLQEVPKAFHTQIQETLVTALALALRDWTGSDALLVEMEGHGREEIVAEVAGDVDVSRTVGWFTSTYPVHLELKSDELVSALRSIKEQLRGVPERGIGYGVWRYLGAGASEREARAEVSFNYLGQLDQVLSGGEFRPAKESAGASQSRDNKRPHLLAVNGMMVNGQLQMVWGYSEAVHRRETIERVATQFIQTLRALVLESRVTEQNRKVENDLLGQWGTEPGKRGKSLITAINSEGTNRPMFCVSSYGDDPAFMFTDLSESLGAQQPFYGLWVPDDEPFSFSPLAARHVEEIQRVQPHGPYTLGGFSFGGVVAFEIARQLRAKNEEVARLVLFETVCPLIQQDLKLFDDAQLAERIVRGYDRNFRVPESTREVDQKLAYILDYLITSNLIPASKDLAAFKTFLGIWRRRADYTPESYSGEVILFRTRGGSILNENLINMPANRSAAMESLGWSLVANKLNLITVPGQHANFIFVPHAPNVAAKLRDHLG
jgi:amino acid adenylation domain-containing protein/non-ribosomal peptide synthase protein (TIGR01720 family)